ncbi:hypothetical protein [Microvirga brassicacearum]|uniref:Uncharacterized protein n=1 Tax=Microvirga brassicacearum TaxID=2580413 RepID=A0A5N3PF83_9HYPH|nr:hypothetical protein [Microvirga brassicacearum]KAB0268371.1 hypothetical protein FEZ63_05080 [Microvirga brassicacearum]
MPQHEKSRKRATDKDIEAPRLTPQGRAAENAAGEDMTAPQASDGRKPQGKKGQPDKAEG